ncbi:hypothetical protein HDV00_002339 [Rhizophlyctis rosea]|nr:hypothetical protein HDV00_002339 [Rhizophlyctis rosea]
MPLFTTTVDLTHAAPIPPGPTKETCISVLHNHDVFIHADPHLVSYKQLPAPSTLDWRTAHSIPAHIIPVDITAPVHLYEVTDNVPNPVYSSSIVSTEELVDTATGLWVRVKSPLSVVMETKWEIREISEGSYEIVQTVHIDANRMLIGLVKSQVEAGYEAIYTALIKGMVDGVEKE